MFLPPHDHKSGESKADAITKKTFPKKSPKKMYVAICMYNSSTKGNQSHLKG
jgi:hypothetical protein